MLMLHKTLVLMAVVGMGHQMMSVAHTIPEQCLPYMSGPHIELSPPPLPPLSPPLPPLPRHSPPSPPSAPLPPAPIYVCFDTRYFSRMYPQCESKVMQYFDSPVAHLPSIVISTDAPPSNVPFDGRPAEESYRKASAFGGGGWYGWGAGVKDGKPFFGRDNAPQISGQSNMSGGGAEAADGTYAVGASDGKGNNIGIGTGAGGQGIGMGEKRGTGIGIGKGKPGGGSLFDFKL